MFVLVVLWWTAILTSETVFVQLFFLAIQAGMHCCCPINSSCSLCVSVLRTKYIIESVSAVALGTSVYAALCGSAYRTDSEVAGNYL